MSLPLSRLIFKKPRIGWSMGFVPSFFGTPCGYTRVVSWAQPKLWLPLTALSQLARQPALRLCRHVEFAGPLLSRGLSFTVSCSLIQHPGPGTFWPQTLQFWAVLPQLYPFQSPLSLSLGQLSWLPVRSSFYPRVVGKMLKGPVGPAGVGHRLWWTGMLGHAVTMLGLSVFEGGDVVNIV